MKRLLLSLIVAGGLALMAAPQARAGTPGPCGKSYAFIINGSDPSVVAADGSATLPGAITQAVGVGSITFAAGTTSGCTATGEIIYNAGDMQTNPIGEFFGPSYCYSPISGFNGAPCFDGNDHRCTTRSNDHAVTRRPRRGIHCVRSCEFQLV